MVICFVGTCKSEIGFDIWSLQKCKFSKQKHLSTTIEIPFHPKKQMCDREAKREKNKKMDAFVIRTKRSRSSEEGDDRDLNKPKPAKKAKKQQTQISFNKVTDTATEDDLSSFPVLVKTKRLLASRPSIKVEQAKPFEAFFRGRNVFVSGSAGSGKSTLAELVLSECDRKTTLGLAATKQTASRIGGQTFASLGGNGMGLFKPDECLAFASSNNRASKQLMSCRQVVIDDIHLVSFETLSNLDALLR